MAKQKLTRGDGKTRIEVRFDDDLAAEVKAFADEVGISTNQLIQGVMRWAVHNGYAGEPEPYLGGPEGFIPTRSCPGKVWFGQEEAEPAESISFDDDGHPEMSDGIAAYVAFILDFTERRALIDGLGPQARKGKKQ